MLSFKMFVFFSRETRHAWTHEDSGPPWTVWVAAACSDVRPIDLLIFAFRRGDAVLKIGRNDVRRDQTLRTKPDFFLLQSAAVHGRPRPSSGKPFLCY
jgi:hypothetical protein